MADATVAVTPLGRVSNVLTLTAIPLTITLTATVYATASGGAPFDLFAALATFGPTPINYKDIVAIIPAAATTGTSALFLPIGITVGTATSSTLPCWVRLLATGAASAGALGEIAEGAVTASVKVLLLIARGGVN